MPKQIRFKVPSKKMIQLGLYLEEHRLSKSKLIILALDKLLKELTDEADDVVKRIDGLADELSDALVKEKGFDGLANESTIMLKAERDVFRFKTIMNFVKSRMNQTSTPLLIGTILIDYIEGGGEND